MTLESLMERWSGKYSVFARNLHSGQTLALGEHQVFPSASLIKVPILAEVFRRVEEEGLSLDETLLMRPEDQVPGSGVLKDLTPGTRYTLRDLSTLMITVSDNTATNLLIDYLTVDAVNALLRRLGLLQTTLERRLERVPAHVTNINRTTAYEMSRLMELLATGQLISQEVSRRMIDRLERCQAPYVFAPQPDDPRYIGQLPAIRVAHKTGSLRQARHDTGIVFHAKGVFVATVLSEGAPTAQLQDRIHRIGLLIFQQLHK